MSCNATSNIVMSTVNSLRNCQTRDVIRCLRSNTRYNYSGMHHRSVSISTSLRSVIQATDSQHSCMRVRDFCAPKRRFASAATAKVSAISLTSKKRNGKRITMVTAYDFPSAVHVARAGMDVILVGDSVAMVELGFDTTQPLTLEQSLHHCQAVHRGVQQVSIEKASLSSTDKKDYKLPLLVGDMPFGSYEYANTDIALTNAYRYVKEAGMDAVKVEGGSESRAATARHIVDGGIAVMGHIGLTPQAISVLGGFRAQGRTAIRARQILDQALRLQDAGCFAIVLECLPANVASAITSTLEIPTIGIGAGGETSGQVLVYHDMLGMLSHPHHEQFVPKFCKRYAQIGHLIQEGLKEYKADVESDKFPGIDYCPYVMKEEEKAAFDKLLAQDAEIRETQLKEADKKYVDTDEYEKLHLYGGSGSKVEDKNKERDKSRNVSKKETTSS